MCCSQPAIYVASLAAVEKLRATEGQALLDSVDVACGLSLGEYTALAFAGMCRLGGKGCRGCCDVGALTWSLGNGIIPWCGRHCGQAAVGRAGVS